MLQRQQPAPTNAAVLGQEAAGTNPSPVDAIIHRYEDSGLRMTETEYPIILVLLLHYHFLMAYY